MFLRLPIIEDGFHKTVTVNVIHIISMEYVNHRNVDAGTFVFSKDSRYWESPLTIDVLQLKVDKIVERFGNQILVSYLAEQMPQPKKRSPKKPTNKSTHKTTKY